MNFKLIYKKIIKRFPYVREVVKELEFYNDISGFKPGHYYSPIVNSKELKKSYLNDENLLGIDTNKIEQFKLLDELKEYIIEFPYNATKNDKYRYYYQNEFYSYNDAVFLHGLIRHVAPKRIIEVGSGYSSALILDISECYFNKAIELTCIEPNPDRLMQFINLNDHVNIIEKKVQDVETNLFNKLQQGDILFIDSSHVAKTGSDLNHLIFNILPNLNKGVIIHFHDIFYPFEYPKKWIFEEKRNWNENYFLKAFLMYNTNFKIILFNTYLLKKYEDWFKKNRPECLNNNENYGSLWLKKEK